MKNRLVPSPNPKEMTLTFV